MIQVTYEPIGIIHSPFKEKAATPIQGMYDPDSKGEVEVFPQYGEGLKDIAGFSHLILICRFHLAESCSLITRS
ncbi:MAG: TrmO family methyltransferase domain-containing protein [Thermodesulfobacteriota bacterium]